MSNLPFQFSDLENEFHLDKDVILNHYVPGLSYLMSQGQSHKVNP